VNILVNLKENPITCDPVREVLFCMFQIYNGTFSNACKFILYQTSSESYDCVLNTIRAASRSWLDLAPSIGQGAHKRLSIHTLCWVSVCHRGMDARTSPVGWRRVQQNASRTDKDMSWVRFVGCPFISDALWGLQVTARSIEWLLSSRRVIRGWKLANKWISSGERVSWIISVFMRSPEIESTRYFGH
jgi:hypothetical protein